MARTVQPPALRIFSDFEVVMPQYLETRVENYNRLATESTLSTYVVMSRVKVWLFGKSVHLFQPRLVLWFDTPTLFEGDPWLHQSLR